MGAFTKIFQRLKLTADTNVSTQTTTVIAADTTNSSIAIVPNGTGAIIASVPDGTVTGGNMRGTNAVDLQIIRSNANQVAASIYGVISGGTNNRLTYAADNTANYQTIAGGTNNAINYGSYCTISGGGFNTAGSGAGFIGSTVIGGVGNTSNHTYTIAGGSSNTASGNGAIALGTGNTSSGSGSVTIGGNVNNSGTGAFAFTSNAFSSGAYSTNIGTCGNAYLQGQFVHGAPYIAPVYEGTFQTSEVIALRTVSLNSSATAILSLDGTGTTNLIIPANTNRLWAVKVIATAFVSIPGPNLTIGDSYMGEYTLLFKKVGGVSSVVGVTAGNIIYDTNMLSAAFTFAAGASQDLQITFKAPTTASATTFRCVARVELTEVAY